VPQIARHLNMSAPTAKRIVDQLIEMHIVRPIGQVCTPVVGRPRTMLELNSNSHAVIGIDLGGTKMMGIVADLTGNILHQVLLPSIPRNAKENLAQVHRLVDELLAYPLPSGQRVLGIGVGAPSITRPTDGIVVWAPSLGWREFPLKNELQAIYDIPVFVENDVNLAALSERSYGAGLGVKNFVCIAIGTGIGAGIVLNGTLYRGSEYAAGEIGYLPPGVEFLGCRYEGFGPLESLASGSGIAERARKIAPFPERFASDNLNAEDVFALARAGETWMQGVIDDTVDYLALAVASFACVLNPEVVILGGGVGRSADLLINPIRKRLEGVMPCLPRIVASPLDNRAVALGAITLVFNEAMEYAVVTY
jgi:glucokinase